MQRAALDFVGKPFQQVSILTRPEGRMQPLFNYCHSVLYSSFNPHPARRPDATAKSSVTTLLPACFNPHPARRPDATCYG